jgi:hypothetical protein
MYRVSVVETLLATSLCTSSTDRCRQRRSKLRLYNLYSIIFSPVFGIVVNVLTNGADDLLSAQQVIVEARLSDCLLYA